MTGADLALFGGLLVALALFLFLDLHFFARGRDPSFRENGVKVGARVVPGSIVRDPGGRSLTFRMTDGAQTYAVAYRGIAPDTFTDGVDVIVEGRLGADGTFRATTLLAKCASRYENAPEKYRSAPG